MGNRAPLKPQNLWKWMKAVEENGNGWTICGCKAHQGTIFSTICISAILWYRIQQISTLTVPPGGIRLSMPKRDPFRGVGAGPQYHPCNLNEYNPPWDITKTSQNMSPALQSKNVPSYTKSDFPSHLVVQHLPNLTSPTTLSTSQYSLQSPESSAVTAVWFWRKTAACSYRASIERNSALLTRAHVRSHVQIMFSILFVFKARCFHSPTP